MITLSLVPVASLFTSADGLRDVREINPIFSDYAKSGRDLMFRHGSGTIGCADALSKIPTAGS